MKDEASIGQIVASVFFGVIFWYFAENLGPSKTIGILAGLLILGLFKIENYINKDR